MFTGLIQDVGQIESVELKEGVLTLGISSSSLPKDSFQLGASVACNGCCLTVVKAHEHGTKNIFYVEVGPETKKVTLFDSAKVGDFVNLESALKVGDPFGGHYVSGHIDTLCEVKKFLPIDNASSDDSSSKMESHNFWNLTLAVKKEFAHLIIPKGSIAVAGVSLTIAEIFLQDDCSKLVQCMIIPHTYEKTNLRVCAYQKSIEVEFDQNVKAIASVMQNMVLDITLK